jgi:hypothetical protein
MSGSKLLEQAIVDAQALRDSAYKSAQAALVEKFAPQIKEAVEKLLEQGPEENPAGMTGSPEDALAADIPAGTDFGGAPPDASDKSFVAGAAKDIPLAATDGEKLCACPDNDKEITLNIDLGALSDELKIGKEDEEEEPGMEPQSTGMMNQPSAAGGAGGPAPVMESLEIDEDLLQEEGEPDSNIHDESMQQVDEELTEVNLDEILSESEEIEDDEESEDEEETEEDEESEEDDEDEEDLDEAKKKKPKSDLGSLSVKKGIDKNEKVTQADILAARGVKLKKQTNESKEVQQTKELIKASSALLKEVENKDAKINKLLEENKKFSSTVEEMSLAFKKLEEVNTLNARLFYENQVLKSASLNERQKTHIVEAISKADSVSEAKTVYETLINSVGGPAKEERSPKSLSEAINKKSSFRLPHKQTEQPNDSNKDRWLKLAGIK